MLSTTPRKGTCQDCGGSGQIVGTAAANGLALAADCPACGGSGRR
jgi:DnaJ-class molecular chaperone